MPSTKYISIHAAEPIGDEIIEAVCITIDGHLSSQTREDVERLQQQFKIDAWKIFNALRSLPGGTFDQLLILMLQKCATSFVVPHRFHDESAAPDLLEACKAALRLDYLQEHNAIADQLRAAIAKAERREVING